MVKLKKKKDKIQNNNEKLDIIENKILFNKDDMEKILKIKEEEIKKKCEDEIKKKRGRVQTKRERI